MLLGIALLEEIPSDEVETRAGTVVIDRSESKVPPAAGDGEVVHGYLAGITLALRQRSAHQQCPVRLVVGRFQREVLCAPVDVKIPGQVRHYDNENNLTGQLTPSHRGCVALLSVINGILRL